MMQDRRKINLITLGCSKNLVDTELLLSQLKGAGYAVVVDAENAEADTVIVNTCGFIGDAKEESVETVLEQVALKNAGKVGKIIVMGCLSQRYGQELKREIPEIDALFGKFEGRRIIAYMGKKYDERLRNVREITTPGHFAYLKISEGCNRHCSYCTIPLITGVFSSRPFEDIIEEALFLAGKGVRELMVIAQDLSNYGTDLYGRNRLAELVEAVSDIPGIRRIRLHYAYPAGFPMELLKVMRERPNVCRYLDIALQHSSDRMLRLMRRGITREETKALLRTVRNEVPGICIRTTMMTGHPGETEEDFEDLCRFVEEERFEKLGVFPYSHEEGTYCARHYKDDVPDKVKKRRADRLMEIQAGISGEISSSMLGKRLEVSVDRREGEYYVGRTEFDSYEVDGEVFFTSEEELEPGCFCTVFISGADNYDLYGRKV